MRKSNVPTIVITSMTRYHYFQWFLLGLYKLEEKGEINLKFKHLSLYERLSFFFNSRLYMTFIELIITKIGINVSCIYKNSYNLEGYIVYKGKRKSFCIDCSDSPFLYNLRDLIETDLYFKMQCPVDFPDKGFRLTDDVFIPWCAHEHVDGKLKLTDKGERIIINDFHNYTSKIRPLMIGVKFLAWSNSRKALYKSYDHLLESRSTIKSKKVMCYFGDAKGPKPILSNIVDYDKEAYLMGCFGKRLSHPNEKRAIAADILNSIGESCDGRVINRGEYGSRERHTELIVPIKDFSSFVSQFEYNLNISGFRKSIPSRFIDSFISGTAIITDKLSVKWYKPFEKCVVETVEMGYLPDKLVNWDQFKKDIKNLPTITSDDVIDEYEKKWSPLSVSTYILNELLKTNI